MNIERNYDLKKMLLFQTVFWGGIVTAFNTIQYSAGFLICGAYIGWYILEKDSEKKFLILLSGLPFQAITKITSGTPSISVLLYLIFLIERLVESKGKIKSKMLLGIFGLILLQILAALKYNLQLTNFVSVLLTILFAGVAGTSLEASRYPKQTFISCGWVFSVSMLVDIYSVSVFPQLPYYILKEKQLVLDRIGRFCALNGDPNYYGQLISVAFGIMISLAIIYYHWNAKRKCILCILIAILLVANGMRSISKGFALGIAATIIMCVWFVIMENRTYRQGILYFILFFAICIPVTYLLIYKIALPVIEMRSETDLFTGRLNIWSMYAEMLKNDPSIAILGTGFSNAQRSLRLITGHNAAAHNLYIEVFFDIGIVGLIMISLVWSNMFKNLRYLFKSSMSLFVWGFLFTSLSLSASANDIMYFIVPMYSLIGASDKN